MRELTSHKVNPANEELTILVRDEPGSGGANHSYEIVGANLDANPSTPEFIEPGGTVQITFQNGPINEVGVNGVTHEALLAILIDRLEAFQSGPYACAENSAAMSHLFAAQEALHSRTRARMARNVEGTHTI